MEVKKLSSVQFLYGRSDDIFSYPITYIAIMFVQYMWHTLIFTVWAHMMVPRSHKLDRLFLPSILDKEFFTNACKKMASKILFLYSGVLRQAPRF